MSRIAHPALWLVILIGGGAATAVTFAALAAQRLPDGPVAPVFDKEACAACKMHVGEPRFAAQLQTTRGDVWFFDDPGCLAEHLIAEPPAVHAIWFHHHREDRWVSADRAGFVPVQPTPMGFGYGAVDVGTPDAIPFEALCARVRAQREARR